MSLITLNDFLKTVNPGQYLEIFVSDRKHENVMCGFYKAEDVPDDIKHLYVTFVASGTKKSLQCRPANDDISSVLLLDVYDDIKDAHNDLLNDSDAKNLS